MTIRFCISAYTDPVQFGRLLRTLSSIDCEFHVHIDAHVDQEPFERHASPLGGRCRFVARRFPVRWGGFNQVRYQNEMLRSASRDLAPGDSIFLLSGTDYPLAPAREFAARMAASGDQLRAAPIHAGSPRSARDRYRLVHVRDLDLGVNLATRAATAVVREASRLAATGRERRLIVDGREWCVHVGSSYFALSAECVAYVLEMIDRNEEIWSFFRYSFVAEEMIWHTVLMNSPYRDRFTKMTDTFALDQLAETHYFEYDGEVKVIGLDALDRARCSGKLFGRKFATGRSDAALDRLDEGWGPAALV